MRYHCVYKVNSLYRPLKGSLSPVHSALTSLPSTSKTTPALPTRPRDTPSLDPTDQANCSASWVQNQWGRGVKRWGESQVTLWKRGMFATPLISKPSLHRQNYSSILLKSKAFPPLFTAPSSLSICFHSPPPPTRLRPHALTPPDSLDAMWKTHARSLALFFPGCFSIPDSRSPGEFSLHRDRPEPLPLPWWAQGKFPTTPSPELLSWHTDVSHCQEHLSFPKHFHMHYFIFKQLTEVEWNLLLVVMGD